MRKIFKIWAGVSLAALAASLLPTAFAQTATTTTTSSGVSTSSAMTQASAPFPDVSSDYVNADAIDYLKTQGVVQGYPDGDYHPSDEINRAEFTKIVMGSLDSNPSGANCFPDVKDEWFAPYVCEAKSKGIISGYDDGTFKPADTINFSEAAKIIVNAYGIQEGQTGDQWFKPYVTALQGKNDIPLSVEFFNENVKRDAMAEMIYRLKANVSDKATRTYDEVVGDNFVTVNSCQDLQQRFDEQSAYNSAAGVGSVSRDVMLEQPVGAPVPTTSQMAPEAAPTSGAQLQTTSNALSSADQGAATSQGAATDFSTTNVQVAGVDEGDVIKNDGKYIYIIKGSELRVVEAYPAENLKELVSFTLGNPDETFNPTEMYVDGNQLTVVGSDYKTPYGTPTPVPMESTTSGGSTGSAGAVSGSGGTAVPDATGAPAMQGTTVQVTPTSAPNMMIYPYYNSTRTKVFVIDITDRTKPVVTRSVEFDGNYYTSRKVGSTLYMVMNYYYSPIVYYGAMQPGVVDSASGGTATSTSASTVDPALVPQMVDTKTGTQEAIASCSQIRILPKEDNFNYLITAAVPLSDLSKNVSRSVVIGSSDNVYASQNNLYVAANDWGGGFYRPYGDYDTAVYKFALGNGTITYNSKGKVPGQLLNQFSMDESNGYFRVATTKNEYVPGSEINNNVYVLDSGMKLTGKIENIAPGEKLYSARFMGNKAYLVTFKRVDPFFVLDLSSPTNPKIAGKLKIPGYSEYLQPYDDNHILGFGYDVDASLVTPDTDFLPYNAKKGLKISMFDVTNLANPKEMFTTIIGDQGTYSEVLDNHKALLFDKDKQLLALPITVYQQQSSAACTDYTYSTCPTSCQQICVPSSCTYNNGIKVCTTDCDGANSCLQPSNVYPVPVFDGAYVYTVNLTDGFQLKGKITHYNADEQASLATNGYTNYEKTIQRLLYMGEDLYSVSQGAVKANALSDLSEKNMIELAGSVYQIYYGKPLPL